MASKRASNSCQGHGQLCDVPAKPLMIGCLYTRTHHSILNSKHTFKSVYDGLDEFQRLICKTKSTFTPRHVACKCKGIPFKNHSMSCHAGYTVACQICHESIHPSAMIAVGRAFTFSLRADVLAHLAHARLESSPYPTLLLNAGHLT